jgi:hypothetical protein
MKSVFKMFFLLLALVPLAIYAFFPENATPGTENHY